MPVFKKFIMLAVISLVILISIPVHGGLQDFFKQLKEAAGLDQGLSESRIIEGLKEALQIGTGNAVSLVSRLDGYYKNPEIKISLPGPVQKIEKVLRGIGYGSLVDNFERSMNRAAEQAAPEAKTLFWDTIKQMSFDDARKILKGRENEATLYFQDKTQDRLKERFKPIIHNVMSKVGVTRTYQQLETNVRGIPFADNLNFDLDEYVTDRSLDGLFLMLAEEEKKIRQDASARVTDLLKQVFANQ
ncbi:MAG: DUF4197 domain-containing protein [Deltaproteobacteria bacterium]|nr:DUF4197 domain-containing protein [Deltaproteobacteria bacterium]